MNLPVRLVEKPWGVDHLPVPFATPPGQRIGEIWFEPPAALPQLLAKYIFTSEALSVQVHPSDAQTQGQGLGPHGKEECWLVTGAAPGAKLGIGFVRTVGPGEMAAAARDGSIEALMAWHEVAPGDFYYIPANTVHAIGAGVSLVEVQQNSDITYRLYDYARPRELHLDAGIAVASGAVYDKPRWHRRLAGGESAALVEGPFSRLDRVCGRPGADVRARFGNTALLVLPLLGEASIDGKALAAGGCALAGSIATVTFDDAGVCLIAQPV